MGHAAVSLMVARALRVPARPVLAAGLAPDVDFLLIAHPAFNAWHRVATHSLVFAVLVATLACVFAGRSSRVFLVALVSVVLHLLCDAMLDGNASNGVGVAWLWPWSAEAWSPLNLMQRWAHSNAAGWADPGASLRLGAISMLFEMPFWAAAWLMWRREQR